MKYIILATGNHNINHVTDYLNIGLVKLDNKPLIDHALQNSNDSYIVCADYNAQTLDRYLHITKPDWDIKFIDVRPEFTPLECVKVATKDVEEPFVILPVTSMFIDNIWVNAHKNIMLIGSMKICDSERSVSTIYKPRLQPIGYTGFEFTGVLKIHHYKEFKRYIHQKQFTNEDYVDAFMSLRSKLLYQDKSLKSNKKSSNFSSDIFNDQRGKYTFITDNFVIKYNSNVHLLCNLKHNLKLHGIISVIYGNFLVRDYIESKNVINAGKHVFENILFKILYLPRFGSYQYKNIISEIRQECKKFIEYNNELYVVNNTKVSNVDDLLNNVKLTKSIRVRKAHGNMSLEHVLLHNNRIVYISPSKEDKFIDSDLYAEYAGILRSLLIPDNSIYLNVSGDTVFVEANTESMFDLHKGWFRDFLQSNELDFHYCRMITALSLLKDCNTPIYGTAYFYIGKLLLFDTLKTMKNG